MAKETHLRFVWGRIIPVLVLATVFCLSGKVQAESGEFLPKKKSISFYYLESLEELLTRQAQTETLTAKIYMDARFPKIQNITAGYFLKEILARLDQLPLQGNPAFRAWVMDEAEWIPSLFFMELGRLEFSANHQEGLKWFAVGHFRSAYDAKRCIDTEAYQTPLFTVMARNRELIDYARTHQQEYMEAQKQAFEWDKQQAYTASPVWMCAYSLNAVSFKGNEPQPVPVKNILEAPEKWPAIRSKLQDEISLYLFQQRLPKDKRNLIWQLAGDITDDQKDS